LPIFLQWARFLSPFKYSYDACLELVFNAPVKCDNGSVMTQCLSINGSAPDTVAVSDVLSYLYITQSLGLNSSMLIVFLLFIRLAAYLALRFVPHNTGRK
jgi:hypothetical protein